MKETKFKAWLKEKNRFADSSVDGIWTLVLYDDGSFSIKNRGGEIANDETAILLQYTRLHDKNNNEICEGDILNAGGKYRQRVFYDNTTAGFRIEEKREGHTAYEHLYRFVHDYEVEIIGNIYQNVEALTS